MSCTTFKFINGTFVVANTRTVLDEASVELFRELERLIAEVFAQPEVVALRTDNCEMEEKLDIVGEHLEIFLHPSLRDTLEEKSAIVLRDSMLDVIEKGENRTAFNNMNDFGASITHTAMFLYH